VQPIKEFAFWSLADRKMLETELKSIAKLLNATIIQGRNKHFEN
jgi:hypothetical protein